MAFEDLVRRTATTQRAVATDPPRAATEIGGVPRPDAGGRL